MMKVMKQMINKMWVHILDNGTDAPKYATSQSAGCDLTSIEDTTVDPGGTKLVRTGLFIEVPIGFEAQVRPRSGLALKHSVTVLNTPGTVDSDYRGEIGVIMINHGRETFIVHKGDKVAQLVFAPVFHAVFEKVEKLNETVRGAGGFGSTGV